MADIKLFNINKTVKEYQSGTVTLEKELQTVIENNMNTFFGVTFLASEYRTTDGGRMDSIGIDENHCPVIFEYKRSMKENVINQGLFYLNWLLDHKDSFKVLVIEKLGLKAADDIDWTMPRVVCIAGDFTKYDESAIKQMNRNISLIRYKKFGDDLLMFEQINENIAAAISEDTSVACRLYLYLWRSLIVLQILSIRSCVQSSCKKRYPTLKERRSFIGMQAAFENSTEIFPVASL